MERPPECWPPGCSPTWLAAITKAWFSIARARLHHLLSRVEGALPGMLQREARHVLLHLRLARVRQTPGLYRPNLGRRLPARRRQHQSQGDLRTVGAEIR